MKIEKELVVKPMTTDGEELHIGDKCVFNAGGRCFTGVFKGITKHGAISFEGLILEEPAQFNVMPNTISYIKLVETPFPAEFPNKPE